MSIFLVYSICCLLTLTLTVLFLTDCECQSLFVPFSICWPLCFLRCECYSSFVLFSACCLSSSAFWPLFFCLHFSGCECCLPCISYLLTTPLSILASQGVSAAIFLSHFQPAKIFFYVSLLFSMWVSPLFVLFTNLSPTLSLSSGWVAFLFVLFVSNLFLTLLMAGCKCHIFVPFTAYWHCSLSLSSGWMNALLFTLFRMWVPPPFCFCYCLTNYPSLFLFSGYECTACWPFSSFVFIYNIGDVAWEWQWNAWTGLVSRKDIYCDS